MTTSTAGSTTGLIARRPTPQQRADRVRALHAEGAAERDIAAALRISKTTVHRILTRSFDLDPAIRELLARIERLDREAGRLQRAAGDARRVAGRWLRGSSRGARVTEGTENR